MPESKTILIVDDDPLITETFARLFGQRGLRVLIAENGRSALEHLEKTQIDVVLLDILMPERDGLETLIEIRRRNTDLPVYVMSGGGTHIAGDFLPVAKEFGATALFQKPLSASNLSQIVESANASPAG